MNKAIATLFLVVILSGCNKKIEPQDLSKINGYWEIEYVILPDGTKKEYKVNETIDFFEITNNVGYRQKVMPQLDGKYQHNNKAEKVQAVFEKDKAFLKYATDYNDWQEEILDISDENLVLKNGNNLEYHYKKPIPFTTK